MVAIWHWFRDPENRAIVIVFATGFAACVAAWWAWYTRHNLKPDTENRRHARYSPGRASPQDTRQKRKSFVLGGFAVIGAVLALFIGSQFLQKEPIFE
jgi:hypothetical protein